MHIKMCVLVSAVLYIFFFFNKLNLNKRQSFSKCFLYKLLSSCDVVSIRCCSQRHMLFTDVLYLQCFEKLTPV
jgi:hypothetical protein